MLFRTPFAKVLFPKPAVLFSAVSRVLAARWRALGRVQALKDSSSLDNSIGTCATDPLATHIQLLRLNGVALMLSFLVTVLSSLAVTTALFQTRTEH